MKEAEPPRSKPDNLPKHNPKWNAKWDAMPKFRLRERNTFRDSPVDVIDDKGNVLHEDVSYVVGKKIIRALERYCGLR